jgi:integrase
MSARQVQTQAKPGYHADGAGLYLQVKPTANGSAVTRSWLFRFKLDGQAKWIGLGSARDVSLAQARQQAAVCRQQLAGRQDPSAIRKAQQTNAVAERQRVLTFDECAQGYITAHRDGWRNAKHAGQWESTLKLHASPVIGKMAVDQVTLQHVLKIIEPIWRTRTETASRLRGRLEVILDWAAVRGFRQGDNPARWRGHLDQLLPQPSRVAKVEHHPALEIDQVPSFMESLEKMPGNGARALAFLILTAARSGELRGMVRSEIDEATRTWTVPGERMKAGREHRVPLSDPAWALLPQPLPSEPDALLFPAPRGGAMSDMTLTAVMRRMGMTAVPHGFRSTFRDWCAERTDFQREVAEMALAHAIGDKVEAAYRRGDLFEKRRQLMVLWAGHCFGSA